MDNTPIYNSIAKRIQNDIAPFHMPGHKGNSLIPHWQEIMPYDITELPDTDSLYEASGIIEESQRFAAELFGSKRTLFSAGGCTLCIQAMLYLACGKGGKIIIGRNAHRSAVNTLALLDTEPVWIMPSFDAGPGLPGRISADSVKAALETNMDARAVYITSPDYYGCISPIDEISTVCKQYDVPLLVDNAHGTHLAFIDNGHLHPLKNGADICADSAHKTLPVLTGGALLHINNGKYVDGAMGAMALFGSTSPSYLIMQSLESAISWVSGSKIFDGFIHTVEKIKKAAVNRNITLPVGVCDPTRITLNCTAAGMDGYTAAEYFRKCGIEPEMATSSHVVLIPSPLNKPEHFERLLTAIDNFPVTDPITPARFSEDFTLPKYSISPRKAMFSDAVSIEIDRSEGFIAAESVCPCPPSIPIVTPGEIITCDIAQTLIRYGILSVLVVK